MEKTLITREVWWASPPKAGQKESDLEWGYLEIYSDGSTHFDTSRRPTPKEIAERKGCRIGFVDLEEDGKNE